MITAGEEKEMEELKEKIRELLDSGTPSEVERKLFEKLLEG